MRLRELWRHKPPLAIAAAVALLVAARVYGFGLLPPSPPEPAEGRATAQILVDTPHSTMLDLRQSTYEIAELNDRALLVGNAMANVEVRERIARRVGVPVEAISIETPLATELAESGGAAPGQSPATSGYRLDVQVNPTVPVIDIDAGAPTRAAAMLLSEAAAETASSYIAGLQARGNTPPGSRLDLVRLGRSQPLPSQPGRLLPALLVFGLVFAAGSATVLFVARKRRQLGIARPFGASGSS